MSLLTAVHVSIVDRWLGDAPLVAALDGPYVFSRSWPPDLAKPGGAYRYVTVGDKTQADIRVLGPPGSALTLTAHAWSYGLYTDAGVEEVVDLMGAALVVPLSVDGYGTFILRRELAVILADPDPEYRHANVRYRISTMGAA